MTSLLEKHGGGAKKPAAESRTMALYRSAADSLPDPKGPLSTKLTSSTIREANEAVRSAATKPW